MGWLSALLPILTSAAEVYTSFQEAKAIEEQAEADRQRADATRRKTAFDIEQSRKRTRRLLSKQKAKAAASGLKVGSFSPLFEETISEGELEAWAIRTGGEMEAKLLESSARQKEKSAKGTKIGGVIRGGSTLLTGFQRQKKAKLGE